MAMEYGLSRELRGHTDDVRRICVCGSLGIATSSRDRTVRFWPADGFSASKIMRGHTRAIGPVVWVPRCPELPDGGLVSGGMDTEVIFWDVRTGEKRGTLSGHQVGVTGIALDGDEIVASSLDCALRRWTYDDHVYESWEAHDSAIQAVIKLPSGKFVTGSSDKTLKLWKGKTWLRTFDGHSDTVCGLAYMHERGILSASHDGSIRLWALTTGENLKVMTGHASVVNSVDSHMSDLIVSSSKDCTAKIWRDGVCIQTIEHPGCVWDAKFLENGDIVTACSDGVARIWTSEKSRIADRADIKSYAKQLCHYKESRSQPHGDESRLWLMVALPNCSAKVETHSYKEIADLLNIGEDEEELIIPRETSYFLCRWENTTIFIVPAVVCVQNTNLICISFRHTTTAQKIQEDDNIQRLLNMCRNTEDQPTRSMIAVEIFLQLTCKDLKDQVYSLRSVTVFERKALNDLRGKLEMLSFSTSSLLSTVEEVGEVTTQLHTLCVELKAMKRYMDGELLQVHTKIRELDELIVRNNKILLVLGFISSLLVWVFASMLMHNKLDKEKTIGMTAGVVLSMVLLVWRGVYSFMH